MEDTARIVLEVPHELKSRVVAKAKENRQSAKAYLVSLIEHDLTDSNNRAYVSTHYKQFIMTAKANIITLSNAPGIRELNDKLLDNTLKETREILCKLSTEY